MPHQRAESEIELDRIEVAGSYFAGCFANADRDRESVWVAHLDDWGRCLQLSHYVGDETGAVFPLRSIIVDVAAHGSAGIVLAHNHPSGDERPSQADCRATRRLVSAAEALDCRIVDHLIYAGGKVSSFQQMGLL